MAPGAKAWSSVLPAATTLVLLAVILTAKATTTTAAVDDPAAGDELLPVPHCSGSHLPKNCIAVLKSCGVRSASAEEDCASTLGDDFAKDCCNDLFKMKVVDKHQCARCALLKEFDGLIDLTTSCTNGVNYAAAQCKKDCEDDSTSAECNFL